jgi:hypothetical protein
MKNKLLIAGIVILAVAVVALVSKSALPAVKQQISLTKSEQQKPKDEISVIRLFMADPALEITFVRTDLPQPYFMVGKVTKLSDGENIEKVDGWVRQVNVHEDTNPLSDTCGVYQYHIDPRNQIITQVVTRGLRPNEIEALKQKGTPCSETTNETTKLTKSEAEQIAFGYLSRALPNFDEVKDQFVYSQDLKAQTWLWEDKDYQLPEGLEGRPYSYPIIRLTVFSPGQILFWNTVPLFQN